MSDFGTVIAGVFFAGWRKALKKRRVRTSRCCGHLCVQPWKKGILRWHVAAALFSLRSRSGASVSCFPFVAPVDDDVFSF